MKPSFFIVGAPKCGTTALAEYLNSHVDIFISTPKEPHYFADDFPIYKKELPDLGAYEALFDNPEANCCKISGEASVWYMYSKCAIKNIKAYDENSKIIVMLRSPLEVVESLHKQLLWVLDEDDENLESAWKKQSNRLKGVSLPEKCREPKFLQYKDVVHYSVQLERLYSVFSETQIKIVLFDEFKEDTSAVYKGVLEFLGMEYDGKIEFKKINERKENINLSIAKFTQRPPVLLVYFLRIIKKILGINKIGIMSRIQKINADTRVGENNHKVKAEIRKELYCSISELEKLLNFDFKSWKY